MRINNGAYRQHSMIRPDEPSIEQGDLKGNLINETTKQEDISSLRAKIEQENNIVPIKEFGTNYAEFYHDGKGAIDKLLTEREGQVAGAFYRKELGDITLPWGEVSQSGNKIKGYGLAKIIKKHGVEILNELPNVFKTGALIKQNDVHYRIESGNYVVGLSAEFKGKKHNFVLTAFERVGRETDTFTDPSFKVASDNLATNSNKNIISQKGNLINEKAKNSTLPNGVSGIGDNSELGLPNEVIPKQTQELDKTLENRNVKFYKNKEDALVKEGYLNPTWEPQLKTIAKEHALDEAKLKEIFLDQTINTSKGRKPNFFLDLGYIVPTYGKSKRSPEYTNNLREIDDKLQKAYETFVKPLSASESKKIKTLYANPHIASGLLGGTANGTDENGNISPEEFAKGFIYALFGSKITAEGVKRASPELYNKILSISKKPSEEIKKIVDDAGADKLAKQEKRGIYNVTYNGKFSTPVYKDLEDVEGAVRYAIGNKNKGAKHIEIKHLEDTTKEGYITKQELLNMGENMRKFIKEYKEPFINDRKARLYEWEDKDGVRFRLVINDIKDKNGGSGIHSAITSTSANDDIITFYSDRNLKEPMKFENPKLKLLDAIDNSSDKVGAVEKILLNKHISDDIKAKAVNRLTRNKISQVIKNNCILVLVFL